MADAVAANAAPSSVSTDLAVTRTRLAHERTLMAWVRTATSLISFGFTIYKFFDYLRGQGGGEASQRLFDARKYALIIISIGLIALLLATLQHRRNMKELRATFAHVPYSEATVLAGLISILGVLTLLAVIFRQ
jgi:inner membrane protein YidH